uniref:NADH-ubiquinone oxidoreductase chain 2 n=1 Tax=Coralliophila richardi TaxID=2991502 RepID=A0A9E8G3I6_9CAEN|nr:NADH dehydrogenase subunit 2 [Coralliophila richardi]UZT26948.1 NADH dehydrogenase subunit 2 [Coralliophila richardi]
MFAVLPYGYMFMAFMMVGTGLSLSSVHWLGIWAGMEVNLIGFLPLLIYEKKISESESGVKYFVIQALGSSLLLLGSLMLFSVFSWEILGTNFGSVMSFWLLLSGLCIKLGLFPFHYWLPGVMAGLSWLMCLLLATWQKIAPLFLMSCLIELGNFHSMVLTLSFMSVGASLVGGMGGLNQTQMRALLAYSSIGHLGWMIFALLHSEWSMKSYFFIYVIISICLFCSLGMMDVGVMKNIQKLKMSSVFTVMMLLLLSLGGLPPLLGFISKWAVFLVSISGPVVFALPMLIVGSLLSLFYYLSLFFSIFLHGKCNLFMVKEEGYLLVSLGILNLLGGVVLLGHNILVF